MTCIRYMKTAYAIQTAISRLNAFIDEMLSRDRVMNCITFSFRREAKREREREKDGENALALFITRINFRGIKKMKRSLKTVRGARTGSR